MTTSIHAHPFARIAALALGMLTLGACGKKADQTSAQSSSGAIAPTNGVQVADITLGRGLTADKHVANPTDTFAARDTIYASVHTTGAASNANVAARWTFQDGQVVDERSETIAPSSDTYTEFHIAKPSGWPTGNYTLHVLVNGQEVQTKNFHVQ